MLLPSTSMPALVQSTRASPREWVVDGGELELKDDLLIDMIMRRIEDAPDKHFQESVSVLMGDRANSFTNDMCAFLLNGKDPITNDLVGNGPLPTRLKGCRQAANPVFASAGQHGPWHVGSAGAR